MARTNVLVPHREVTHEEAPASRMTSEQALRRSVMSCLLWEREFYEDGQTIADRIMDLSAKVKPETLASLAIEARHSMNLRHVPLLLLVALVKHGTGRLVADTINTVISRADEPGELVSLYWKLNGGRCSLSNPMRRGLARAITKFDAYELAKYNRDVAVKPRDVLFLTHAKPKDDEQAAHWKALVEGTLAAPDTWEVALSGGADKKKTFERLLRENRLGYLALLRNLWNMVAAGVDRSLVTEAILSRRGARYVLPFRYIAAVRACPQMAPYLDAALRGAVAEMEPFGGETIILVDVSGSMDAKLSERSDMTRMDAAAALAAVWPGQRRIFTFSSGLREVQPWVGMACVEGIIHSQPHQSTELGAAVMHINGIPHDRLVVITDEQSHDRVSGPAKVGYVINVASAKNGVGYGRWTHIDGFSEGVLRYIREVEGDRPSQFNVAAGISGGIFDEVEDEAADV